MQNKAKKYLKKTGWIYNLNARIKAVLNLKKLKRLQEYYSAKAKEAGIKYGASDAIQAVRKNLAARGINTGSFPIGKLRIFWVGTNIAQDESGFLQGLRHFGEVVSFKNELGDYGMAGANVDQRHPDIAKIIESNGRALLTQVEKANTEKRIDLFLGQMWADVLDAEVLQKIQKMGIPVINISMDDKLPALWDSYRGRRMGAVGLGKGVDLTLTTTPEVCPWYAVEGYPAIYWPLASDPKIFYPRADKKYDVVFIGSNYGLRTKLVEAIEKAGIHADAFGPGWPNGSRGAEESAEIFGSAKIILGTGNIGYNEDVFTIKLRDFDAPMSGALYITHRNPDLLDLFEENREIVCYASIDECVQKIRYYLDHPNEMQKIAEAGFIRASQNYFWDKRIGDTLALLGFSTAGGDGSELHK